MGEILGGNGMEGSGGVAYAQIIHFFCTRVKL